MKSQKKYYNSFLFVTLVASFCCILWGSAFAGVKLGYKALSISQENWASQMLFAGVRFFIAGIMALIIGSVAAKKILLPQKKNIGKILELSLHQTILQYSVYYIGLAHTTGVRASVIITASVFTSIFIAAWIFKLEQLTIIKLIGCIIGFGGILLMKNGMQGSFASGDILIFISTIFSGFSSVLMKIYTKEENPFLLSGWQFAIGGVVLSCIGIIGNGKMIFTPKGLFLLFYLALVSALAYSLWSMLLKYNSVGKVSVYNFLKPVFGSGISCLLLHEHFDGIKGVLSLIFVCIGILMVQFTPQKK